MFAPLFVCLFICGMLCFFNKLKIIKSLGLVFGLGFALLFKLPKPSAVSVGIETSQQNTGLCMAILMVTIKDDEVLDRALGIPVIYTALCWIVNAVYILVLYRLGWTMHDTDDNKNKSNDNDDIPSEMNCCILMEKYKLSKQQSKLISIDNVNKDNKNNKTDVDKNHTAQLQVANKGTSLPLQSSSKIEIN